MSAQSAFAPEDTGIRRTALFITDDARLAATIARELEAHGWILRVEPKPAQHGLQVVKEQRPDIVFLDLDVREVDGLQLCRTIRADSEVSTVPIIVVSASQLEADPILGLEQGADDYLIKPFAARELLARARAVLRRTTGGRRLLEQTRRQAERLRLLAARLGDVEERERHRLATELHDQVGQNLTALGVSLSLTAIDIRRGATGAALDRLTTAERLLSDTASSIRTVLLDLRPPGLDDQGLIATLRGAAGRLSATTGIRITVEGQEPEPRMDAVVTAALYRIAQEAVINAVRHASATRVAIAVVQSRGTICLTVADDGKGFDLDARDDARERPSWGLMIMEERALSIGARFRLENQPGHGATVIVEIDR